MALPAGSLFPSPTQKTVIIGKIQTMTGGALEKFINDVSMEEDRQARDLWKQYAARKELIDFEGNQNPPPVRSGARRVYGYNADTQTYFEVMRDRSQRVIPRDAIKLDVNRFALAIQTKQRALMADMLNGKISPQEWYNESTRLMKISYRATVIVARGNNQPMTDDERNRWLLLLLLLFLWLNQLADAISDGDLPLNGRLPIYAGLRGAALRSLFENWKLEQAKIDGYQEARRVLGIAEHCHQEFEPGDPRYKPGCVEEAAKGWVPIAQVLKIGLASCKNNCKCHLEFRLKPTQVFQ
jgi:hypothetical protein